MSLNFYLYEIFYFEARITAGVICPHLWYWGYIIQYVLLPVILKLLSHGSFLHSKGSFNKKYFVIKKYLGENILRLYKYLVSLENFTLLF